ncbi:hypothetical protein MFLAVUS_008923 [Mucor flavus]|uniref:Uncharacterized protein n=1 Tax=Mucor flavus TaxID=439312 RepID=A0ABP9Z8G4_9FUNG
MIKDYSFRFNNNDELFTTYRLYGNDFYGSNRDMNLPKKTSSAIGPEIFDALELGFWGGHENVLYRALNYSIVNCPKLQIFYMTCYGFQYYNTTSSIGYKYEEDQFCSDQTKCAINYLKMEYINPAQYCLDLVTTHLHNIETLSLTTKECGRQYNDSVIDLLDFKKLKAFIYTSRSLGQEKNCNNQENILVLIKYINGEEQYYYPDGENGKTSQVERDKTSQQLRALLCFVMYPYLFTSAKTRL